MTATAQSVPLFEVTHRDQTVVIKPSSAVATALENDLQQAASRVLDPLRARPPRAIVVDLSQLDYFGSLFLTFLIRCHSLLKKQDGRLVLAGASPRAREVLCLTALDSLWDTYPDAPAAIAALNAG
jgi:anti-anti-sigma factor